VSERGGPLLPNTFRGILSRVGLVAGLKFPGLRAQPLPTVIFSRSVVPAIAAHIASAQARGYPSVLSRTTNQSLIDQNRRNACRNFVPGPAPNTSCDEYPFASTYQGGAGASIQGVPVVEQLIQGGILSSFYRNSSIPDRGQFSVVVR